MSSYVVKKTPGDSQWYRHDRFGMFIHWGLYALPARGEWVRGLETMSPEQYMVYFKHFNPDLYDAKDWARQAKAAGMKYVVLTTKHHDGFCLFDSKYTDFKATNTPAGRDLVREYVDAFRAEGIHIGLYYSLLDWHHPEFPLDNTHPLRNHPNAAEIDKNRDMTVYAEYMRNQVTELMTNYGKIDLLFFDFNYPQYKKHDDQPWMRMAGKGKEEWESEKLIELVRKYQPHILINDRTGIEQDIFTPEQWQPKNWFTHKETGEYLTWEVCHTFSGHWGYARDQYTWKSPAMLLQTLINSVAYGGNLIMNVGPTARGTFDYRAEAALKVYADWMKYNSRSIYGCTMAEPELLEGKPDDVRYTQSEDGKRLYVHLFNYPFNLLVLEGLGDKVEYAQFLHDGSEIQFKRVEVDHTNAGREVIKKGTNELRLILPVVKPNVEIPVIELFLK